MKKEKIRVNTFLNEMCFGEYGYGKVYYKDGKKLKKPYELTEKDFIEISESEFNELTPEKLGLKDGFTYGEAKSAVIKTKYSNDDQIALMLNYQNDEKTYKKAYEEMQTWRLISTAVAKWLVSNQ